MNDPRSILITGGSSGIGEGLCLFYAKPGVTIALNGRDKARIAAVADKVRSKGATVYTSDISVTDSDGMASWIKYVDEVAPLDLVIANAGIGASSVQNLDPIHRTKAVYDVNVNGVFNTVYPAIEPMLKRGRGQIAIVSSIAGFMGLPNSPSYSSSKAAVKSFGRALRSRYGVRGIEVNVICPGVIHTRMTEDFYKKSPGWIDVETSVRIITNGLRKNRGIISFPWWIASTAHCVSTWPDSWLDFVFGIYMKRKASKHKVDQDWIGM